MKKEDKIDLINQVLLSYFANPNNPRKVQAKELMERFIKKGIFNTNNCDGLPLRTLLRELDDENRLDLIHYVLAVRHKKNTNWYFVAEPRKSCVTKAIEKLSKLFKLLKEQNSKGSLVSSNDTCQIKQKNNARSNSDEYYVISLCNKVLKKNALQQHTFDFLVGDSGKPLPVDAYYEDLNLVVEYHERQHTESVKFFDNKMTVSGVNRGEQRKIYDQRRESELPKHGIKLVIFDYSDFGSTKKLKRDPKKDIEVVRTILAKNEFV